MEVYIKGIGNISPQFTTDNNVFLNNVVNHESDFLASIEPNYNGDFGFKNLFERCRSR